MRDKDAAKVLLAKQTLGTVLQVEDKTVAGLLGLIEADRNGEAVDKTLLKHLVRMFTSLGTYATAFEEAFLDKTNQYYSLEGQRYMQESDVADYLLHCEVGASLFLIDQPFASRLQH